MSGVELRPPAVVVGVDGSDCAAVALEQAAVEASLRHAPLRIVCAWEIPILQYSAGYAPLDAETVDVCEHEARQIVDAAVAHVGRAHPELEVRGETVEGQGAAALVRAGENASLIVVGNRGRGGLKSLLLGSVGHQVVLHADCPVMVVRGRNGASQAADVETA